MKRLALLGAAAALVLTLAASAATRSDYASFARSILPPGEAGGVDFGPHSTDQAKLYDALTPLAGNVSSADVQRDFKAETLWSGREKAVRVERPGRGVRILRDTFDVPHVFGKTEEAVEYGAGYAAAEDRGILMELARYPGRLACLDAPGYNAFAVALSGKQFAPSAATEARLAAEVKWLTDAGAAGRQALRDIDAYVAGINAYRVAVKLPGIAPWTRTDVVAMDCLLGARFGAGGGEEAIRSEFLSALRASYGQPKADAIWNDLREQNDPEAPVTSPDRFPYEPAGGGESGNVVLDDGSVKAPAALAEPRAQMSNALLIGARRSATGHPLFVAGPQLGYFYPEFFMEEDLHGGRFDVRGGMLAGIPNVLIGRGPDYVWSATSSNSDNVDTFAETLCGGDDHHYLFNGQCRAMTHFDAGVVKSSSTGEEPVAFWETVHGPVFGYATSGGRRVALSSDRSTRGRELRAALPLSALSSGQLRSPQQFFAATSQIEFSFNFFYADSQHIATWSAGRLPLRASGVDPGLPTIGDGTHEWSGFLAPAAHPHSLDPASGVIVNWNNKPGAGFGSADDNWAYGPLQRVDLLAPGLAARKTHTTTSVVAAMNQAATEDIRAIEVLPVLDAVLAKGVAPSARAGQMLGLLDQWRAHGGNRLDGNLDGKIDDPGAAIMDAAWPKLADAVLGGQLSPLLLARLNAIQPRFDLDMFTGWMNYVDKDLRTVAGDKVAGPYRLRYCGGGDAAACAKALWSALDAAGAQLAASQGPDPSAWRGDATVERIHFAPGILPDTMRWTNRPTFQQVVSFGGHR